jgi:hypothetical protein
MNPTRLRLIFGLGLVLLAACDVNDPQLLLPAELSLAELPAGLQAGQAVEVRVTALNSQGQGVRGAAITWVVTAGSVDPATSTTGDNGVATTTWTLGTAASQSLTARAGEEEAAVTIELIVPCEPSGAGLSLEPGESVALTGTAARCVELTEAGRYLISVFNSSTAAGSTAGIRLSGTVTGTAAMASLAAASHEAVSEQRGMHAHTDPADLAHLRILEANRRIAELLSARSPSTDQPAALAAEEAPPSVGDLREFRIPDLDADNLCSNHLTVTARAAYVGSKTVIWEDTLSPLAGTIDADWDRLGQEVDDLMYPTLVEYFGDPLIYNASLSGNGRLFMLFSEEINQLETPIAGFVFSGDFFSRTQCASSDQTEIFYARIPTLAGSGYDGDARNSTVRQFMWSMRSTVMHELKHVAAYARKMWNAQESGSGPTFEATWLEEATARLAEEFYARSLFGYGQGDNVMYEESVWCEVRIGNNWPDCDPYPSIMQKHFGNLQTYLRGTEGLTPIGATGSEDASFYGSGWLLVRWAIDHSGLPEATFSRAIVEEPSMTGVANLTARSGRSFPDMLADWTLALAMDDHPTASVPARAELTHPGWNVRDIYRGLHDDFGDRENTPYPSPWPLATRDIAGGTFTVTVTSVRGGSAAIFDLSNSSAGQLLGLQSAAGGVPAATLGLSIVRIQ